MIEVITRLPENVRPEVGKIYYEAFQRKLQPLVGKPAETQRVLTAGLNLRMAIGISLDGKLRGLAGLHNQAGVFSRVNYHQSVQYLNVVRGTYAWVVLNLFGASSTFPEDHLRIAALAVAPDARGRGLGSLLLEAVARKAQQENYRALRLEVVDTNPRARALYERSGFQVVATHSYPINPAWLGFSRAHVMVKPL
jgi:ribosomal protein S18 acetylase RimI-like enzyme